MNKVSAMQTLVNIAIPYNIHITCSCAHSLENEPISNLLTTFAYNKIAEKRIVNLIHNPFSIRYIEKTREYNSLVFSFNYSATASLEKRFL